MSELHTEIRAPEFTIGLRGYDRTQVDEYIEYLQRLVAAAQERARDAETEHVFDQHAAIGPRVAEIFALAEAEARDLREQVTTEATGLVSEARTEATAIINAAEHSAREIRERAQREQEEILAEFEHDRDRIRDEAAGLEMRKAEAIGELNRLRAALGKAAGVSADDGTAVTKVLPAVEGETIELPPVTGDAEEC